MPAVALPLPYGADVLRGPAVESLAPVEKAVPAVDRLMVEVPFSVDAPATELETPVPLDGKLEPVAVGPAVIDPFVKV